MPQSRILILTIHHGASHARTAAALRKALEEVQPDLTVEIVDALEHCSPWFRTYYNSYLIPLRFGPALWGWIESLQHVHTSTGPGWLYRQGVKPLFRFLRDYRPDVAVATEVGLCEWAAMYKRESGSPFLLVGMPPGVDIERPWAQPEVDLYVVAPGDVAAQLEAAGVSASRIEACGQPLDPAFASLPDRAGARTRLRVEGDVPLVLVLFGGTGAGTRGRIVSELNKVRHPMEAVFIAGKNPRLEEDLRRQCQRLHRSRVLGWVDNIDEWMAAADFAITKPGATTLMESLAAGLPLVAIDPLPGDERRACDWIETHQVGQWVKRSQDLGETVERLLEDRHNLCRMRERALRMARPHAARDGARRILERLRAQKQPLTDAAARR